jgi:hypothetical protein
MQIEKHYKIEKAASTDEARLDLNHIFIRDNCTAMASDGRMLAIVPCAIGQGETPGTVTPDSLAYARKHTLGNRALLLHLPDKETAIAEDTTVFPRELTSHTEGEGEQLELIRDSKIDDTKPQAILDFIPPISDDAITLVINPTMLKNLAEALGDKEKIIMYLTPDEDDRILSPIRVHGADGAIGAIMPMRGDD